MSAKQNLLFGILALQNNFINRAQLLAGFNAWVEDKPRSLADLLLEQKALTDAQHALLLALTAEHLRQHDDDADKSLAAISSVGSARQDLEAIADPELHASLAQVAKDRLAEDDPYATRGSSVGIATSSGQRFHILRPHAKGGLGEVFVASDTELHREVALKEIQSRFADHTEARGRFLLEAEITGGLEHPGVVPVYGLGQYADGRPFYAMRFIKGDSLKDAIAAFHKADLPGRDPGERTLALRKLLGRFIDVCNAIAYAHSRGVLHRDLKPGNIMLGQYGETLVVDWGLAKAVGRSEDEKSGASGEATLRPTSTSGSAETVAGSAIGTPAYMSPEQAAGRLDLLGPASDVYSLGATLYSLLTGKPSLEGGDVGALLQRVQKGDLVAPRQVNPAVAPALEAVCRKAMALRPEDRYATVRALADDIEHWLADEPVSAWPEPWTVKARRWLGRHRTMVTSVAAAVLVAAASLSVATILLTAANEALVKANENERNAKEYALGKEQLAKQKQDAAVSALEDVKKEKNKSDLLVYAGKISLAQREWEGNDALLARELLDDCRLDFRGWEHDYLYTVVNSNQRTLRGHKRPVTSVVFSSDGKLVVSGSEDNTVTVWNLATGKETLTLRGHTGKVSSIALSADSKLLISGSYDKTVKVWDFATGKEILTLKGHTSPIQGVAFSRDGKCVVSSAENVKVWDAASGQNTLTLGGGGPVALSPDGKFVAGVSVVGIVVWDVATGEYIFVFGGHNNTVTSIAFSPDSKRLVTGSMDRTVKVWDLAIGQKKPTLRQETLTLWGHREPVNAVAFSPDSKRLVSGSGDWDFGEIKVWDAMTGEEIRTFRGHEGGITSVAFSPDGKLLVSGSLDQTLKVWNTTTTQAPLILSGSGSLAFSPDGKLLASGGGWWDKTGKAVKLWDVTTGQNTLTLQGHIEPVNCVAFCLDGKLVSGSSDKMVKVWNMATGQCVLTLKGHARPISSVAISPDGKHVASGGWEYDKRSEVIIWDVMNGQEMLTLKGVNDGFVSLAFSPDGKHLASGGGVNDKPGEIGIWDATSGQEILTLKGHEGGVTCVTYSPDGKRLASGGNDMTVKVWDVATGRLILTLKGNLGRVTSLVYSPDAKRLVSCQDRSVKVWDAGTGQHILTLRGHSWRVGSVAFSPDGKCLATACGDGTIRLWDASAKAPPAAPSTPAVNMPKPSPS